MNLFTETPLPLALLLVGRGLQLGFSRTGSGDRLDAGLLPALIASRLLRGSFEACPVRLGLSPWRPSDEIGS